MKRHDISISLLAIVVCVGLAGAGCSGGNAKDVVVQNQGQLCVYPASETSGSPIVSDTTPRDYAIGDVANVAVLLECLSGSCTTNRQASCTATLAGNMISVDATGSYHDTGASECTLDCAFLLARCATPPLPAGTYTISYAGHTTELSVASMVPPPCTL
ncbi:MAG TPA: hypothetical protein VKQ32_25695 [Polyangia bacterium]|nr:hypothetical protein [Polyangia bacterium]